MIKEPKISIAIPVLNEEKNIGKILKSIFDQNYPISRLEVFVVDNGSTDKTLEIAKNFPVKILNNPVLDAQYGKMMVFNKCTGEYFTYFDADVELRNDQYFNQLLKPLLEDKSIVASFTKMYVSPSDGPLTRFLTFDSLQRDPIYEFFSPSIESTITSTHNGYFICTYKPSRIPPAALCLFRLTCLKRTSIAKSDKFMDLDNLAVLVASGYSQFAYVPQAGFYHHHIFSLKELIRKRLRNISRNYIPNLGRRYYTWFKSNKPLDIFKIILLIIYANLFIPALLRGIIRSFIHKDPAGLLEPIVTLIVTDTIIYGFLRDKKGRDFAISLIFNLFKSHET